VGVAGGYCCGNQHALVPFITTLKVRWFTMHPLIERSRSDISRICRKHHVRRLEVFGSAARGSDFDPQASDADFLVEFVPGTERGLDNYFGLKSALEALLQRGVDLVEPGAVRNPYLLAGINASRELVYAA
jgi:predicted nucleotidyltransferase